MTPLIQQYQTKFDFISRTLHTPMVFREIQVYGTIPQLLGVFAKLVTQIYSFMIKS
jgi:hypothetical protein